jgi:hypothetical protein
LHPKTQFSTTKKFSIKNSFQGNGNKFDIHENMHEKLLSKKDLREK